MTEPQASSPAARPPAKKKKLSVRIAEGGAERIRRRAVAADITSSHMVRRMLAYADEHMPADWLPGRARAHAPAETPAAARRRPR